MSWPYVEHWRFAADRLQRYLEKTYGVELLVDHMEDAVHHVFFDKPSLLKTVDPQIPRGWKVESLEPWSALTDEANADRQWLVARTVAPFCGDDGVRQWHGPTIAEAFRRAGQSLNKKVLF